MFRPARGHAARRLRLHAGPLARLGTARHHGARRRPSVAHAGAANPADFLCRARDDARRRRARGHVLGSIDQRAAGSVVASPAGRTKISS